MKSEKVTGHRLQVTGSVIRLYGNTDYTVIRAPEHQNTSQREEDRRQKPEDRRNFVIELLGCSVIALKKLKLHNY